MIWGVMEEDAQHLVEITEGGGRDQREEAKFPPRKQYGGGRSIMTKWWRYQ